MDSDQALNEYLVCYDYGMGGIWYRILAPSAAAVREAFPHFILFENEPDWWKTNPIKGLAVHRLGDPLDAVLVKICQEANERAQRTAHTISKGTC